MAVRWPDGSFTGSVRVKKTAPAPVKQPEPETTDELSGSDKKETK